MIRSLIVLSLVALGLAQYDIRGSVYPCPLFGLGRLQHRNQCGRYIQCVNGDAVERSCAPGLHFNAATGECSSPESARCRVEDGVCPLFTDPRELIYLFDGERCDKYYLCFGGVPQEFNCEPGYNWAAEREQCEPENVDMCAIVEVQCPEGGNGRVAHPGNCQKYFHCENGRRYGAQCRFGYLFDILSNSCMPSYLAECEGGNPTPPTPPTPPSPPTPPPEIDLDEFCDIEEVGDSALVAHPYRCDWFISCESGVGTEQPCEFGEIFYENECVEGDFESCLPLESKY